MKEEEMISLANLGRGACIEKFDDEFQKVLINILDPNTNGGKREINLRVIIKPNQDRNFCTLQVHCTSKLGAVKAFETQMFVGLDVHGPKASEHNPKQLGLGFNPGPRVEKEGA